MTSLFQRGAFTLHSGETSSWKIECDALTSEDWDTLATIAMERFTLPFGKVIGIPTGGMAFARALEPYQRASMTILIVDDVLTSGQSMLRELEKEPTGIGLVAFARGPLPFRVAAVFRLGERY